MLDYAALHAVAAVARIGSFEGAARAMGVTPSAVSQRIKNLETRLGFRLLVRGAPCVATEQGEWLCRHVEQVGLLESDLFRHLPMLQGSDTAVPSRLTIHIAVNADSLASWFMPAMAAYTRTSGHLLHVTVEEEGETAEWLAHGRVQAAVTSREEPIPGCRRIGLGTMRYRATASPSFASHYFSGGLEARAFAEAPALTFSRHDCLQTRWMARELELSGDADTAPVCPSHWLPSTQGFLAACLAGIGWGMNPESMVAAPLGDGRLVALGQPFDVSLFWQVNRLAADMLLPLTQAVIVAAREGLTGHEAGK